MKLGFFDQQVRHIYYGILSALSVVGTFVFAYVDIKPAYKLYAALGTLAAFALIYIAIWLYYKKQDSIRLKINNSEIEVKFGDIFSEEADLKAIAFNEYFDTKVDDVIISASSLNGQYIKKYYAQNVQKLDKIIEKDQHIHENVAGKNETRPAGKKVKYKLGSIVVVGNYLLVAFSHFDKDNKAYLEINDYISCLLNFWNEVDRVYARKTVVLPLLGSGITRFKGYDGISDQELLELIIWTFKVSRIRFTYPAKAKIVIFDGKKDKINLLSLKKFEQ